jgi:hypothetical protein
MGNNEIYLNHISDAINSNSQSRLSYLANLVSLNIAIYAGVYLLNTDDLWFINGEKLFLLAILLLVNLLFTAMYFREHNITRNRDDKFLKYLKESNNCSVPNVASRLEEEINKEDFMQGWTWGATKVLFAVFNSVPIVFGFLLLFKHYHIIASGKADEYYIVALLMQKSIGEIYINNSWATEVIFSSGMIILSIIIWLILTCYEYKRTNKEDC